MCKIDYNCLCAKLPSALDDILDRYAAFLEMEPDGDSAYLFGPRGKIDRPLEMSGYSQACKRAFQAHSPGGQEISPKSLRSSFIVWLRDNTSAPEILRAAAHAQKHSERRQGSDSYDTERDTRLVQAAYDFNLAFVTANYAVSVSAAASSAPSAPSVLSLVRCNYSPCFAMATESLLVCSYSAGCSKVYHKSCALHADCPESSLCCQLCLPSVGQAGGSAAAGNGAAAETEDDSDEEHDRLVDDDEPWVTIPGPFTVRRQPDRLQPKGATTQWRAYVCTVGFNPVDRRTLSPAAGAQVRSARGRQRRGSDSQPPKWLGHE